MSSQLSTALLGSCTWGDRNRFKNNIIYKCILVEKSVVFIFSITFNIVIIMNVAILSNVQNHIVDVKTAGER